MTQGATDPADRPAPRSPALRPRHRGHMLVALVLGLGLVFAGGGAARAAAQQPDTVPPADTAAQRPAPRPAGPEPELGNTTGGDSVQVVDRVVAVAGDSAILLSELQEQIYRLRQQGEKIPQDPVARDSLVRSTLQDMIDRMLLVQRAEQEGVTIGDDQVQQAVQSQFNRIRSGFQSDEAFRQAVERTGQNMFQYRQMLQQQARQELLLSRFRQQLISDQGLPPAAVSDSDVRAYFDANSASARRPASISFERITIVPRPDSAAADSAIAVARKALDEIRSGTDFSVAAHRFSNDPGTRSQGGDMGWIRRSDVVPAFADVAWAAPPGRVVGPIGTRFGFHIIKVQNIRGGEREISQILIRPDIDSSDVRKARERADALADSLRSGADPTRLGREYGIRDQETHFEDIALTDVSSRFGDAYAKAIGQPESGQAIGPFPVTGAFDLSEFVVLKITDFKPAGPYRFEDVKDQIRENLVRTKQFQEYVAQLRRRMYVKIYL